MGWLETDHDDFSVDIGRESFYRRLRVKQAVHHLHTNSLQYLKKIAKSIKYFNKLLSRHSNRSRIKTSYCLLTSCIKYKFYYNISSYT